MMAEHSGVTTRADASSSLHPRDVGMWWVTTNAFMLAGAGLIAWSAGIHLDLWHEGYKHLSTIGPLFLLQAIAGFALALLVAVLRRLVPALAGIVFLASTIGGFIISVNVGLFGFKDSLQVPFAHLSLIVESVGIAVLIGACILRIILVRRTRPVA
jgi:hypothetical protein